MNKLGLAIALCLALVVVASTSAFSNDQASDRSSPLLQQQLADESTLMSLEEPAVVAAAPDHVAAFPCSQDCGDGNKGSTMCQDGESCDCSCSRQPICQCR